MPVSFCLLVSSPFYPSVLCLIYPYNTLTHLLTTSRTTPGKLVMCQEELVPRTHGYTYWLWNLHLLCPLNFALPWLGTLIFCQIQNESHVMMLYQHQLPAAPPSSINYYMHNCFILSTLPFQNINFKHEVCIKVIFCIMHPRSRIRMRSHSCSSAYYGDLDQLSTITASHRVSEKVSAFQWVHRISHSKSLLITKLTSTVSSLGNLKNLITLSAYCDYPRVIQLRSGRMKHGWCNFYLRINTWKPYLLLKIEERRQWTAIGKACIWFTKFIKERMSTCFKLQNEKRVSLIE